jgi:hypothetical protein
MEDPSLSRLFQLPGIVVSPQPRVHLHAVRCGIYKR